MPPREGRYTWHLVMAVIDTAVPTGWGWGVGTERALNLGRNYIAEGSRHECCQAASEEGVCGNTTKTQHQT